MRPFWTAGGAGKVGVPHHPGSCGVVFQAGEKSPGGVHRPPEFPNYGVRADLTLT